MPRRGLPLRSTYHCRGSACTFTGPDEVTGRRIHVAQVDGTVTMQGSMPGRGSLCRGGITLCMTDDAVEILDDGRSGAGPLYVATGTHKVVTVAAECSSADDLQACPLNAAMAAKAGSA